MMILGLTGSIATGKSFVAGCLRKLGAEVFDADAVVHDLLDEGGEAVASVSRYFPECVNAYRVDRKKLGDIVFKNKKKREILEGIIHPLLAEKREYFIKEAQKKERQLVVLEVPLLFETHIDRRCDKVIVTFVDKKLQEKRALERPGMTKKKFHDICKLQMDDGKKTLLADYTIDTGCSEIAVFRRVKQIVRDLGFVPSPVLKTVETQ